MMRRTLLATAIAGALIMNAQAQQAPADTATSIPLSYVGTNVSAGISVSDEGDVGGEVRAFWGIKPKSLWFGEAWGQDYGAAGVKFGRHWIFGDGSREQEAKQPGSATVAKVFVAVDRNRHDDEKATLGLGMEREKWFGSVAVSGALTGERRVSSDLGIVTNTLTGTENGRPYQQTQTIETLVDTFEHPYDSGLGVRFGRFFDAQSFRLQGGLDYERGDFDSRQFTASLGAQKFFSGSGHSLGLDIEAIDKDGVFETDRSDTRGWLTWRYELGGDSFRPTRRIDSIEQKREVKREVPSAPVVVRNEIQMNADAFFGLDSAVLTDAGIRALQDVVDAIRGGKRVSRVSVVGHTCDLGPADYNQALSERRARAVRDWFGAQGIDAAELDVSGKGEAEPKYPNSRDERSRNRRVDVSFLTVEEKTETPPPTATTETIVEWVKTPVDLPNAWIDRALRNPAQHKRSVDVYRYEETTVTETLGARVYLNRQPIAVNDAVAVPRGQSANIAVLANDSDPDGNPLTVTAVTQPAHGTASFSAGGVSYTPAAGYVGSDSFTYTISDGADGTATATVNISVVDRAPIANADSASTRIETPVTIDVLGNDSDPDGDAISVTAVGTPAHGMAAISGGAVVYTPAAGFVGSDSFSYTLTDANGSTATGTVTVSVEAGNRAPVAVDDYAETINLAWILINALANDSDPDGDAISVVSFTQPANGTVVQVAPGQFHYKANAAFCGLDIFTYTIRDSAGLEATATVTVNVLD
ncbi:MAG TPA: Ig-like domain-containing protein [Patescibacteria group bacterium]|nr:Ig-like domain-containing protein [Patescibacteria group bacterium]